MKWWIKVIKHAPTYIRQAVKAEEGDYGPFNTLVEAEIFDAIHFEMYYFVGEDGKTFQRGVHNPGYEEDYDVINEGKS